MAYKLYDTHGFKIYLDPTESAMMKARINERYEIEKFDWLKNNLTKADTFVDVGANKGDFSLLAASRCKKVYAVEPHPDNVNVLYENIRVNHFDTVQVVEACATNGGTTVELGIGAKSGHHSITAPRAKTIIVNAIRLDEFIEDESLVVKIDVEGAEKLVLEGMSGIMKNVRAFLIDIDSRDPVGVKKFLTGFDFVRDTQRELIGIRK